MKTLNLIIIEEIQTGGLVYGRRAWEIDVDSVGNPEKGSFLEIYIPSISRLNSEGWEYFKEWSWQSRVKAYLCMSHQVNKYPLNYK